MMVSPMGALKNYSLTPGPVTLLPTHIFASYTVTGSHSFSIQWGSCPESGSRKQERQWPLGKKLE